MTLNRETGPARIALLYHPKVAASQAMAAELCRALAAAGMDARETSAWDETAVAGALQSGLDVVVTLGGDGTILRAARMAAASATPVLGVNFGRLGYLAEVDPADAMEVVPRVLAGPLHIEDRLMLNCTAASAEGAAAHEVVNDVFVGRGRVARAARLNVRVDGVTLRPFSADGVLVATPTGSTAYNLSAGGPVVYPALEAILVTPVVPHPNLVPPLVLPTDALIEVAVTTDDEATLSLDGQTHLRLASGDGIQVRSSELRARFVRLGGREDTLRRLVSRLEAK